MVVEGVPIAIHGFDVLVGRETEHLVAAPVFPDETGDSIPGLWAEDDDVGGLLFRGALSREDKQDPSGMRALLRRQDRSGPREDRLVRLGGNVGGGRHRRQMHRPDA